MIRIQSSLAGCSLSPLDSETCRLYLGWLVGEKVAVPQEAPGPIWALAHCDNGVTWGCRDKDNGVWHLGNQAVPGISPQIRPDFLQELRLFGEPGEVLIWHTDAGLLGRILRDAGPVPDAFSSSDEPRILRGDEVVSQYQDRFSHVRDRAGAEQILPLAVASEQLRAGKVCLVVRHYYASDPDTGAVRIAATRLVKLISGGAYGR